MKKILQAAATVGLAGGAALANPARTEAPPATEGYTSAQECATCHKTIHTYWSESAHAQSATRSSYLQALSDALKGAPDEATARRACVWCHAPTTLVTGDDALEQPLSREGVTCDFCHTVADVDLGKAYHPFDLQPGRVKRGPLEYAESPYHETAYSALHRSSPLLCASCHEYKNALGAPILSTYTEWAQGPYPARGQTCQECHMPLVPGKTVVEGLSSTQRRINLHRVVGGSEGPLGRGLELRIDSVDVSSSSAGVRVVVRNAGVGHSAPGGLATKSLVVAVGVEGPNGRLAPRLERVYGLEMLDREGRPVTSVADLFVKAASVGKDTRLKPHESRTEQFTVPLSRDWRAVVARLEYRDASDPRGGPRTLLVAEERRERGR
jgi:hypothetical protein